METDLKAITDSEISIVAQGPLFWNKPEGIERCLASLRYVAPNAEVIISTWQGEDISRLPDDVKVVVTEDPGCYWETPYRAYNLNRQLVSTNAGLAIATRPYVLKIRSDLALYDRRCFQIASPLGKTILESKMTITNLYVRNPEIYPLLFHVSDLVQFGTHADMINYWTIQNFSESDVLFPMQQMGLFKLFNKPRFKLVPEQALTIAWLARNGHNVALQKVNDTRPELLSSWAKILTDNFHMISWQDSGVVFPVRFLQDPSIKQSLLQPKDIPRISKSGFDCRRVKRAQIFGANFLLHGRLAYFVGWLQFNHPRTHKVLRKFWLVFLKLRGA